MLAEGVERPINGWHYEIGDNCPNECAEGIYKPEHRHCGEVSGAHHKFAYDGNEACDGKRHDAGTFQGNMLPKRVS